jgi:hypothetical protein
MRHPFLGASDLRAEKTRLKHRTAPTYCLLSGVVRSIVCVVVYLRSILLSDLDPP